MISSYQRVSFLLLLFLYLINSASSETLEQVIRESNINVDLQKINNRDKPITSYKEYNQPKEFLLAYYWDKGDGRLESFLQLLHFDKITKKISNSIINLEELEKKNICVGGSILNIEKAFNHFLISQHISPSASCTLLIDLKLNFKGSISGEVIKAEKETILWEHLKPHFSYLLESVFGIHRMKDNANFIIFPLVTYKNFNGDVWSLFETRSDNLVESAVSDDGDSAILHIETKPAIVTMDNRHEEIDNIPPKAFIYVYKGLLSWPQMVNQKTFTLENFKKNFNCSSKDCLSENNLNNIFESKIKDSLESYFKENRKLILEAE